MRNFESKISKKFLPLPRPYPCGEGDPPSPHPPPSWPSATLPSRPPFQKSWIRHWQPTVRFYCKLVEGLPMGSVHSEGVSFGVVSLTAHQIIEPQMGESKARKFFGFQKFISSVISGFRKFAEFNGEFIFKIRPKMVKISPENWVQRRIQRAKKNHS